MMLHAENRLTVSFSVTATCGSIGPSSEVVPSMILLAPKLIIVAADLAFAGTMAQKSPVPL